MAQALTENRYDRQFYAAYKNASRSSAEQVVPLVIQWLKPSSVIDVGCGIGTWLEVFREHGIDDIFGVDGAWVEPEQLLIPADQFVSADLARPIALHRNFDVVMSCEVAEHIDAQHADQFVKSLTSLAPVVVFSAAIPFQGGDHHVNEQWPDYWFEKFDSRGYECFDVLRPRLWQNPNVAYYYAQNLFVFVKRPVAQALVDGMVGPLLDRAFRGKPVNMVHFKKWMDTASFEAVSVRRMLAVLPRLVAKVLRHKIRSGFER